MTLEEYQKIEEPKHEDKIDFWKTNSPVSFFEKDGYYVMQYGKNKNIVRIKKLSTLYK